jgi:hypothetical protein
MLWRAKLSVTMRWTLGTVSGASLSYLAALLGSEGVWGGVRHAMPLVVALSIPAGAALSQAWALRSRTLESTARMAVIGLLFIGAFAMTIGEKRVWEYHNELVGGSANAYRYFSNEGLDLGQRFGEIRAFHDRVVKPSGEPLYSNYWVGEEQMRAARVNYHRRVESLDDTNVQGVYNGYYLYTRSDRLPWAAWDWDPKEVFAGLELVAQYGYVEIWHGRQVLPKTRASSMGYKVFDYIYKDNGDDWPLVAKRLEEVVKLRPQSVSAAIELGNAYVRIGNGPAAVQALRRPLQQTKAPVDARIRKQMDTQIGLIQSGAELSKLKPLRNPEME